MAVKMLTGMAGADWAVSPGEIFEADAAYEARLIAAGLAEAIPAPVVEKPKGKK
jgi:hypothetical protein